ncbi:MAG: HAD family hydrolase [Micropruina sp.]|uniref:HAD family hydrolase n=1 Tax=Micropruina sp. TaxID=2737536 RepID=UPI0039E4774C
MVTHVVWDWNGTLLDDLPCVLDVTNQLLTEFGLPVLTDLPSYQAIFRFPIAEYYADLGFDTSPGGNFEAASHRYIELYRSAAHGCVLHDGAVETLAALRRTGLGQVVISASEQQNLAAQLAPFALDAWIEQALGLSDIYAASKQTLAQGWLESNRLEPAQVVFVGDSAHDFEIAQALGARCVLFSGGHHARAHLETLGAPVVDDLRAIPALIAD